VSRSAARFAFQELLAGVHEFDDPGENPRIVEYLKVVGLEPDDETSWCSAFVAWCMVQAQVPILGVTGAARSWLKWGKAAERPEVGDVVVLWRGHRMSWQGHVGLYVGGGGGSALLLSGNQSDAVTIAPFSLERVLGYRRFP
jgi:uncharacterized protein (TIGR02594 family)